MQEREEKYINCIVAPTIRNIIKQAQEAEIKRENIVSIFPFEGQIYLIYYK